MLKKPLGVIGGVLIAGMALFSVSAPLLTPYDPSQIDSAQPLSPPSSFHPLGTDQLGRDILSRTAYGGRISLGIGSMVVILGASLGGIIGLLSAYSGGIVDTILQRIVDSLLAFPTLLLALVLIVAWEPSVTSLVLAIGVTQAPWVARIVRSVALTVILTDYVQAAVALGCSPSRVIIFHILPQCVAPFLVVSTAGLGAAIVLEASLSFLGLGVQPPTPSWGGMLSGSARDYARAAPWMVLTPGVALSLTVYGVNLLGDTLRDMVDPRIRNFQHSL